MRKALIVDPDAICRERIADVLSMLGIDSDEAEDGTLGIELAMSGKYDIVTTEHILPNMGGAELCRAIAERTGTPVLFISSYQSEAAIVHAFDAGADGYMAKPFGPIELYCRIRAILRRTTEHPTPA